MKSRASVEFWPHSLGTISRQSLGQVLTGRYTSRIRPMDWKYKHFYQERVFPAPRGDVLEAARTFMGESLGWQVADTPQGLTAKGYSFSHGAIANLRIQPAGSATKVAIELLVERAGFRGFMLFDVGGYYNIQIRKWLDGIQWSLHQKLTGSHDGSTNPLVMAANKPSAYIFNGCLVFIVVMVALYFLIYFYLRRSWTSHRNALSVE
jgi:hypothetical protein